MPQFMKEKSITHVNLLCHIEKKIMSDKFTTHVEIVCQKFENEEMDEKFITIKIVTKRIHVVLAC